MSGKLGLTSRVLTQRMQVSATRWALGVGCRAAELESQLSTRAATGAVWDNTLPDTCRMQRAGALGLGRKRVDERRERRVQETHSLRWSTAAGTRHDCRLNLIASVMHRSSVISPLIDHQFQS